MPVDPMLSPADVATLLTPPNRTRQFGYKRALRLMQTGAIASWQSDSGRWWTYEHCVVAWQRNRENRNPAQPSRTAKQPGAILTARQLMKTLREEAA